MNAKTKYILLICNDNSLSRALTPALGGLGLDIVIKDTPDGIFWDLIAVLVVDFAHTTVPFAPIPPHIPLIALGSIPEGLDFANQVAIIEKPIKINLLKTKLSSLMRQRPRPTPPIQLGPFQFIPTSRRLLHESGHITPLTETETAILAYLLKTPHETVPKEALLGTVLKYSPAATTHTLETHIYRLRRKIEAQEGQEAAILVTENGGYRLIL